MGSQNCRQQQYALDLADRSQRRGAPRAHDLVEVSPPHKSESFDPQVKYKLQDTLLRLQETCQYDGKFITDQCSAKVCDAASS